MRHELAKLLLDADCEVDVTDDKGRTALHHATGTGVVATAQLLWGVELAEPSKMQTAEMRWTGQRILLVGRGIFSELTA